jgi:hypothetical protein
VSEYQVSVPAVETLSGKRETRPRTDQRSGWIIEFLQAELATQSRPVIDPNNRQGFLQHSSTSFNVPGADHDFRHVDHPLTAVGSRCCGETAACRLEHLGNEHRVVRDHTFIASKFNEMIASRWKLEAFIDGVPT